MEKINFENLPSTNTPINAENLNQIQTNVEDIFDGNAVAGNMVVESIRTKNLFGNYLIRNGYISSPAFMRIRDTLTDRMAFVPCEANTTYTVSRSILTTTFRVGEYTTVPTMTNANADYTLPSNIVVNNDGTSITYTTGATAKYLIIMYGSITNDSNINESLASIQVEKGSTATAYTKYQELNPNVSDTGWLPATLTSNFAPYQNWSGNTPKYRKIGNMVNIRGVITPTTTLSTTADQVMFSVPLKYAPPFEIRIICQGSGMNRWMLSVFNTGNVAISRYGVNSQDNITSGNWLPFSVVYFTD